MITAEQYFKGQAVAKAIADNADVLLSRVNQLFTYVGCEYPLSSGYRSPAHNKAVGGAMRSKHLSGQALDVADPAKTLAKLCLIHAAKLEQLGLWCEDFRVTHSWVHFQSVPPPSGRRFFLPSEKWAATFHEPLTLEAL